MRAVVDGIARDHEADRRHVKAGGVVSIGVANIDRDNLVTFKVECRVIQSFGGNEICRNLTRQSPAPTLDGFGREHGLHCVNHLRRCDRPRLRKTVAQQFQPKEMIGMGVGDVDRAQVLAGRGNPVSEFPRVRLREKSVNQQGIPFTVNQRGRIRYPFQLVLAQRCALGRAGAPTDEQLPLQGGVL